MYRRKVQNASLATWAAEGVKVILSCLVLLLPLGLVPSSGLLAADLGASSSENPAAAMKEAEKEFQQAEQDFTTLPKGSDSQKTGTRSWSDMAGQRSQSSSDTSVSPQSMSDPANPSLHGSPETGYAGTWTDPATGDIITSVIAPTPRQNDYSQNYPIIIEPNVGNWNSSGPSGVIWDGNNPQWPTTPDNPGWGGNPGIAPAPPSPPSGMGMPGMGMGMPGQNFYPSPPLPPNFHPGYRPLYPNPGSRPPDVNGPHWNHGPMPGWNPGWNQGANPGWNQGANPGWNQGANPGWNQGANPGWNPGANQGWQNGGNHGWGPGPRPGWNPGGNAWGGQGPGGMGGRPWRGNP